MMKSPQRSLRDLRLAKGELQKDVADDLGVSVSRYSNWETGRNEPDAPMYPRIAKHFHITAEQAIAAWKASRGKFREAILAE